ncbi:hypothetical protein HRI_002238500 [Hibiscus trionum]|uniref:Uncharacterized protein n=1 Tax=Hibiscus trionum TaxID=183268 RepID=A0A9W7HZ91_HIBTR|nr:hypothetical protein HRI_002238500 [Hibiscus trionum]
MMKMSSKIQGIGVPVTNGFTQLLKVDRDLHSSYQCHGCLWFLHRCFWTLSLVLCVFGLQELRCYEEMGRAEIVKQYICMIILRSRRDANVIHPELDNV